LPKQWSEDDRWVFPLPKDRYRCQAVNDPIEYDGYLNDQVSHKSLKKVFTQVFNA